MNDKATNKNVIHQIPAGLLIGDQNTELFGCRDTKKVFALSNGKTILFEDINPLKKALIFEKLLSDNKAFEDLKHLTQAEAIERFAFCIYGSCDSVPDFNENEELSEADNFICSDNCTCMKWSSKRITVDGFKLTTRQIQIVTLLGSDLADKQIAAKLFITESTLDTHKKQLFDKFGVTSKNGLIIKATLQKIIQ